MAKGTADVQYSHMHPPCTPPGMMSRNRELFHSDMPEKQPPELQIEIQIEQKVTQRIPLDIQTGSVTSKVPRCNKEDKRIQSGGPLEHPKEPPWRLPIVFLVVWALKAASK